MVEIVVISYIVGLAVGAFLAKKWKTIIKG